MEQSSHRPCWVHGTFASPYHTAVEFDNLILVATGIGITPAIEIIHGYAKTRRLDLVWRTDRSTWSGSCWTTKPGT